LLGRYVLHLGRQHRQAVGLGYFLAPGLIALAYVTTLLVHGCGFLAVFAAGVALRHIGVVEIGKEPPEELTELAAKPSDRLQVATEPKKARVFLAQLLLRFTEQLGQMGEVVIVALVGSMLTIDILSLPLLWFVPLLLLVIRLLAVGMGLLGSPLPLPERSLI
jgi:NhaP-type Na+/H+ or K+/H+ antiporter